MNKPAITAILALLAAAPGSAATITQGHQANTNTFNVTYTALSGPGGGNSVIGDGTAPVIGTGPDGWGRYNPDDAAGSYMFSNDIKRVRLDITSATPFTTYSGAFTDLNDIKGSTTKISTGKALWEIAARQASGTLNRFTVTLDKATTAIRLFVTVKNDGRWDGWGHTTTPVAPIPLPAPALLLLAGIAGLFGLRRRAA